MPLARPCGRKHDAEGSTECAFDAVRDGLTSQLNNSRCWFDSVIRPNRKASTACPGGKPHPLAHACKHALHEGTDLHATSHFQHNLGAQTAQSPDPHIWLTQTCEAMVVIITRCVCAGTTHRQSGPAHSDLQSIPELRLQKGCQSGFGLTRGVSLPPHPPTRYNIVPAPMLVCVLHTQAHAPAGCVLEPREPAAP